MPIEHIIEVSTFIGGGISAVAYVPQMLHIIKVKSSRGNSLIAWYTWLLGASVMLAYALYLNNAVLIILNLIYTICIAIIIGLIYRYRT